MCVLGLTEEEGGEESLIKRKRTCRGVANKERQTERKRKRERDREREKVKERERERQRERRAGKERGKGRVEAPIKSE